MNGDCNICINGKLPSYSASCVECGLLRKNYKPMTNADRTRQMSDEKLAETYAGGCPNGDRLNCGKYYLHGGRDCFNCWLDWLKAPVEGGEG